MITVIGSINADLTTTTQRLPKPAETVLGTGFATAAGGKGANQALAALRAGAPMRLCGAVGSDSFADIALAELRADRADLTAVRRLDGATGTAMILVDANGENMIVVVPGANAMVDVEMAETAVAAMQPGDTLLLVCEIPAATIAAALTAARNKGVRTLLNIAPVLPETADLAALADVVIANETELGALAELGAEPAVTDLTALAAERRQTLVVTLGGAGAIAAGPHWAGHIAAPKIDPVDTVGAGDTFCGYLGAGLDAGLGLPEALERAVTAGALACLKPGAQPAIPRARDVEAARAS